uniref:uncharacterized protein LOC120953335 isoform X2 n=1 Tax=Anopheles coluzzii TaxID=1518534 RepID=UPI0020FFA51D|nr:uncharacterized protein LOC120953335 isoform X2 [Anopheles coluzzii]
MPLTERVPCKGMTLDRALHFKDMKPERNRWKWPTIPNRRVTAMTTVWLLKASVGTVFPTTTIPASAPDSPFGSLSYEDGLRLWALKTGQTHSALNLLLGHLRQHDPGRKLPRDARTFLNTPVARSTQSAITPPLVERYGTRA